MRKLLIALFALFISSASFAQRAGISTDLLRWGTLSPNVSVEVSLSNHTSICIDGSVNPFAETFGGFQATHVAISPEFRYWFKRPMYSHFFGVNLLGSVYEFSVADNDFKGRVSAAGVTYGYGFIISRRLSLIPTFGVGMGYFDDCINGSSGFKPTVTKFGVGITYIID